MRRSPPLLLRPGEDRPPPTVQLHVGDFRVSAVPEVLYTLLGSCVAVCLYDPAAGVGGMNHVLVPGRAHEASRAEAVARFGRDAVELLVEGLGAAGASRRRLKAKVFGGGHVISRMDEQSSPAYRNARFILELMAEERIPVVSSDLGGYEARKVWFRTDTADVFLKRVPVTLAAGVRREESRLQSAALGRARR